MKEQNLSEAQLRRLVENGTTPKIRDAAERILFQIAELRSAGGIPVCVLYENGRVEVFDSTDLKKEA